MLLRGCTRSQSCSVNGTPKHSCVLRNQHGVDGVTTNTGNLTASGTDRYAAQHQRPLSTSAGLVAPTSINSYLNHTAWYGSGTFTPEIGVALNIENTMARMGGWRERSLFTRVIDMHVYFFMSSPRPNKRLRERERETYAQ